MNNRRVLLISDDVENAQYWSFALSRRQITVTHQAEIGQIMQRLAQETFDLIIIEWYGQRQVIFDMIRQIRSEVILPLLLLDNTHEESWILEFYRLGIDELISKPVSPAIFLAKVTVWLTRSWSIPVKTLDNFQISELKLDSLRHQVIDQQGRTIHLTNLEFRLLYVLMSHPGQILETETLLDRVWGFSDQGDPILLKNVVYRLRRKIEPNPNQPRYIHTAPSIGYFFHIA